MYLPTYVNRKKNNTRGKIDGTKKNHARPPLSRFAISKISNFRFIREFYEKRAWVNYSQILLESNANEKDKRCAFIAVVLNAWVNELKNYQRGVP